MGTEACEQFACFSGKGLIPVFERTRTGLREMPSNAAWLLSKAARPTEAVGDAASSARDQGRRVTAAVVDAAPVGDSVEIRARRARDAGERAREAEERAVEAARESKALADRARQVSEQGHARIKEVERETSRQVKQRVADAEKEAAEYVKRTPQATRRYPGSEPRSSSRTRQRRWPTPDARPTRPPRPPARLPRTPTARPRSFETRRVNDRATPSHA